MLCSSVFVFFLFFLLCYYSSTWQYHVLFLEFSFSLERCAWNSPILVTVIFSIFLSLNFYLISCLSLSSILNFLSFLSLTFFKFYIYNSLSLLLFSGLGYAPTQVGTKSLWIWHFDFLVTLLLVTILYTYQWFKSLLII